MKNKILTRITMSLTVLLVSMGAWLTACAPSGTSMTDMASEIASDEMPVPQYPLSVNRIADVGQTSIVN